MVLHILFPYLVPRAWWNVDFLIQRGLNCYFISWLSCLGLIFEFLRWVVRGGSQFLLHDWLRIYCRLDGVWWEAQFDVRVVLLKCSWWWTWGVGLWISLSRSSLLLGGWNCWLLRWSWIQILVRILMVQARYCLRSTRLSCRKHASHLLEVLVFFCNKEVEISELTRYWKYIWTVGIIFRVRVDCRFYFS